MRIIYYDGKETRKTGFVDNINALKLVFPVSNLIPDDHLHLCAVHGAIYYHETKIDGKNHFFYHWNFLSLQKEISDKINSSTK
ncbi:hypothetical protein RGZ1_155 [Morganella phage vB_MmoM_Rgz1]|nr:hypothetical protein RGZ1_155 [Morganella phage vB_MmoM_Rgz1]